MPPECQGVTTDQSWNQVLLQGGVASKNPDDHHHDYHDDRHDYDYDYDDDDDDIDGDKINIMMIIIMESSPASG